MSKRLLRSWQDNTVIARMIMDEIPSILMSTTQNSEYIVTTTLILENVSYHAETDHTLSFSVFKLYPESQSHSC